MFATAHPTVGAGSAARWGPLWVRGPSTGP